MKLRNKKTGEIVEFGSMRQYWREEKDGGMAYLFQKQGDNVGIVYNSLAELNKEWEDYKPAEPLIKDEKVRKAVRAWADFNEIKEVTYFKEDFGIRLVYHTISIDLYIDIDELENYKHYTIAELCGEK